MESLTHFNLNLKFSMTVGSHTRNSRKFQELCSMDIIKLISSTTTFHDSFMTLMFLKTLVPLHPPFTLVQKRNILLCSPITHFKFKRVAHVSALIENQCLWSSQLFY